MKKWLRRLLALLVLAGVAVGVALALRPRPVEVEAATIVRGPLQVTVDDDGRTRVKDRHVVTAPLAGNLARIELHPGDGVQEGTILARIEPIDPPLLDARSRVELSARAKAAEAALRQAEAHVDRAESAHEFARREAERTRGLAERGAQAQRALDRAELEAQSAAKDVESARFGVRVARYELEMARAALARAEPATKGPRAAAGAKGKGSAAAPAKAAEQLEITAPVAGRVLRVLRESEGAIAAGTPILEVADLRALEVVTDVLTEDAVAVSAGDAVVIERWGGAGSLRGHVRLVEPSAFTKVSSLGVEEQRVNVVIDLDDAPAAWAALGDGFRVETRIVTWEAEEVVLVPLSALLREGEGWAVFVVDGEVARRRVVELGHRSGLWAEVRGGLEAGERVIVHPSERVKEGEAVALP